jgi:hypothetical protein
MSCSGSHLGFRISIKNPNFLEDLQMIIPGQFALYMNVPWMGLYKLGFLFRYEIQNDGYGST